MFRFLVLKCVQLSSHQIIIKFQGEIKMIYLPLVCPVQRKTTLILTYRFKFTFNQLAGAFIQSD